MSQTKGNKTKNRKTNSKNNREILERKKRRRTLAWALAGGIILGICLGYVLGKFWLYPSYREKQGYVQEDEELFDQSELNNEVLQQLNSQLDENSEAQ